MSRNFAAGTVLTPPAPATSGTTLTVQSGQGAWFITGMASLYPASIVPTPGTGEVVNVTGIVGDTLTIVRAQETSTAQAVTAGYQVIQGMTAGMYDALAALAAGALQKSDNLASLTNAGTARTNLGLGTAATQNNGAFDAAGAAAAAQAASLQKASNLADLASPSSALTNLGLGATAPGSIANPPWRFFPEDYAAKADVTFLNDVATTVGSATVTSPSGGFTNLVTGMSAVVCCGSTAGAAQFVTLTKVSNTQATMSTVAAATATCLAAYGTNNSTAYNNCVTAATTYAQAHNGFAEIWHSGFYGFASNPTLGGATAGNAYVPLPIIAGTARKVTLRVAGPRVAGGLAHWLQTAEQAVGAGLVCMNGAGTVDALNGSTVMIGGPVNGYGTSVFTNLLVILDGISTITPWNGTCGGVDFLGVAEVQVQDYGAFALAIVPSGGANPVPTQTTPANFSNFGYFGLRMPQTTNNAVCDVIRYRCEGIVNGFRPSEHTRAYSIHIINCYASIVPYQGSGAMPNRIHILSATCENQIHAIATIDAVGVVVRMDVDHMETEGVNSNFVSDANGCLQGYLRVAAYAQTLSPANVVTGAQLSVYDLKAQTGYLDSPAAPGSAVAYGTLYRDAVYAISGGTVTAITVDGQATGLTSGMIEVPANRSITITYTVAPTVKRYLK